MNTREQQILPGMDEFIPAEQPPPAGEDSADQLGELRAENDSLRNALRLSEARETLAAELRQAGAISPELLVEIAGRELQFDTGGTVANTSAIVEKFRRRFPVQFRSAGSAVAAIDGGAGQSTQPALTREALAKMTPAQIAALDWKEVRRILSGR
jgi:hypothetical protein